jgi:E1A/CREB-binding protein
VLFNARTNKERSEYICPECCIAEIERGERVPRPASSVLGAKDLPRTILSDFVEERLALKLELERVDRAKVMGKRLEEVIGRMHKLRKYVLIVRLNLFKF